MNKAEREGKQHRAAGKSKSTGKYKDPWFLTEADKRNKDDFNNAYDEEDNRRRQKANKK